MFKQFINQLPGADIFMIGSFLLFFVFFIIVFIGLFFADKRHLDELSKQPLE